MIKFNLVAKSVCRSAVPVCLLVVTMAAPAHAKGEPAERFLKTLRNAGYHDLAISYLDRLDQYPGVNPELLAAVELEKAQTFIDAAVRSRSAKERDAYFNKAEESLSDFLKKGQHPRLPEAQMQLAKLQMVRATQLLNQEPDDAAKAKARESLLAAAKTFDAIIVDLKEKLTAMRGQKIDKKKEPEKAALRDQYQFNYLEAQVNAADTRRQAAMTFNDPATEGKALLQEAETRFVELTKKYAKYVHGAKSYMHLGDIYTILGNKDKALDSYLRMLEGPDADDLRDYKFQSAAGLIDLRLQEDPPKFQEALNRTLGIFKGIRPNEKMLPNVQRLRVAVSKANILKSKDDKQKPTEAKRAEADARQTLLATVKVVSPYKDEAKQLLSELGIEKEETAKLPQAKPPKSISDALETITELREVTENMEETLALLEQQEQSDDVKAQIASIKEQVEESRVIAIQTLRRGLAMANLRSDREQLNLARQYLSIFVFQRKDYRDASVVGEFLARNAPGTEMGLIGGVIALNSLQILLAEVPESDNDALLAKLEGLSGYLIKTWPDDPRAASGQTMQIRLLLQKDRFDEARELIKELKDGPNKFSLYRLLGQLLWNESIKLRRDGDETGAEKAMMAGMQDLETGLNGITGALVDKEALQAALVLCKMHRKAGDEKAALAVLDNPKFGPLALLSKVGAPSDTFEGDLYSTELKTLVGVMIATEGDISALMTRAEKTMENLRGAFQGADGQAKLTANYRRLAAEVKTELDDANPAEKAKLINIFRLLLDRISASTEDEATLLWVAQTLVDMGQASMAPNETKATSEQSRALLTTAQKTFEQLLEGSELSTQYQYAICCRLLGEYTKALDILEKILAKKPTMLNAQKEAAQCYESWAGELKPKVASKAYRAAIMGGRPNGQGENTVWGWGKISSLTNRNPKYQAEFFESRYHIALCRFLQGQSSNNKDVIKQAIKDIRDVELRYSKMGGPEMRTKFDTLLKAIQKKAGEKVTGLKPLK